MSLTAEAKGVITAILEGARPSLPAFNFAALNRKGDALYEGAFGASSWSAAGAEFGVGAIQNDTVFWAASLGKPIAGIAVLQLIEQGILSLDMQVSDILPELDSLDIVDEGGIVVGRSEVPITLKMLLTHSAGFSYTFIHPGVKSYVEPAHEYTGHPDGLRKQPLICQPGTAWNYSCGIDWVGFLIEKVTGLSLEEYCIKNIWDPLGVKSTTFTIWSRPDLKTRLAGLSSRQDDGSTKPMDHLPFTLSSDVISAGGGLFTTVSDFTKIIHVLINSGVGYNGYRIISADSCKLAFTDHLGEKLAADMDKPFGLAAPRPNLGNPSPMGLPKYDAKDERGWGITFCLTKTALVTGRGKGSAWWAGLPNCYWWADPEKGVVGCLLNTVLPMGDLPSCVHTGLQFIPAWKDAETALYAGLV